MSVRVRESETCRHYFDVSGTKAESFWSCYVCDLASGIKHTFGTKCECMASAIQSASYEGQINSQPSVSVCFIPDSKCHSYRNLCNVSVWVIVWNSSSYTPSNNSTVHFKENTAKSPQAWNYYVARACSWWEALLQTPTNLSASLLHSVERTRIY